MTYQTLRVGRNYGRTAMIVNSYHAQVCRWLSELGLQYQEEYQVGEFSLDIYLPEMQRGVEIDGPHHKLQRRRDAERDSLIQAAEGIDIVRIPVGMRKGEALEAILK